MKTPSHRIVAGLALVAAAACALGARGQDPIKPNKRSEFMRQKLEFSKNVLEGLAREDFSLVSQNARKIKQLSMAAEWEVSTIPHVEEYLVYTSEFQRRADDLMRASKERNLDGATLAFNRMTMNCVDCHKYVRSTGK